MPKRLAPTAISCTAPATRDQGVRRVGRHHLAFIKGYFEGIDIAVLAERYLDVGRDKGKARGARRWILDELIVAARQRGDAAAVRLLRLPAGALPDDGLDKTPQSLEHFREQVDPEGVYSEAELVVLYEEERAQTAPSRQRARNARLRQRQRLLLDTLEASLVEPPRPGHHVGDWFDAATAARLEAVGLETIEKLIHHINCFGYRWYRRVPRVGERTACRVQDWLHRHADDLALPLDPKSTLPRNAWPSALRDAHRRAAREIAPIECFDPPQAAARADRDALLRALSRHADRPATYRAYRLQAERLLLWTSLVRGTSLSQLQASDATLFLEFATAPTPARQWCGPKAERGTARWRPFEHGVPAASLALVRRILGSLCAALVKDGYLTTNPFRQLALPPVTRSGEIPTPRAPVSQKTVPLLDDLCRLPGGDIRSLRMRVVFSLLRDTGLALEELTRLRVGSLAHWPLRGANDAPENDAARSERGPVAPGKRAVESARTAQRVFLSRQTMAALDAYFHARRLDPTQPGNRDVPLIGRHVVVAGTADAAIDPAPVTPNVLARAITSFLAKAGMPGGDPLASPAARQARARPSVSFRLLRQQARQHLHDPAQDRQDRRARSAKALTCGEPPQPWT